MPTPTEPQSLTAVRLYTCLTMMIQYHIQDSIYDGVPRGKHDHLTSHPANLSRDFRSSRHTRFQNDSASLIMNRKRREGQV
jgi:hypothetical protein